jgi:hypothetical protein
LHNLPEPSRQRVADTTGDFLDGMWMHEVAGKEYPLPGRPFERDVSSEQIQFAASEIIMYSRNVPAFSTVYSRNSGCFHR